MDKDDMDYLYADSSEVTEPPVKNNKIVVKMKNDGIRRFAHPRFMEGGNLYEGDISDLTEKKATHDFHLREKIKEVQDLLEKHNKLQLKRYSIRHYMSSKRYLVAYSDYTPEKHTILCISRTPSTYTNVIYIDGQKKNTYFLDTNIQNQLHSAT